MAAIIRNGNPVIRTGIVNVTAGLAGGAFVDIDETTGKVTANASTFTAATYITINVQHGTTVGDDATVVVANGGLIAMVHPNPGDEITITGITGALGDTVRDNFQIIGTATLNGTAAKVLRRIETVVAGG